MSPSLIGAVGVVVLFALLLLRVPVWIALMLVGFFGNVGHGWLRAAFALAGTAPFDVGSSYTLSVVPLFILMGEVASETGLSGELFNAARVMLSGFRGGLAVGDAGAPPPVRRGVRLVARQRRDDDAHGAAGAAQGRLRRRPRDRLLAAGGSLDILIPPSIILVIYAAIAELSVPSLFAAGLIPGLVLTVLYMVVALAGRHVRSGLRAAERQLVAARAHRRDAGPWQFLALFIVTIGGIYAGVFSPTEAASVGAFGAILLGLAGRRLTFRANAACHREHGHRQRRAVRHRHRRQPVLVLHRADAAADAAAEGAQALQSLRPRR